MKNKDTKMPKSPKHCRNVTCNEYEGSKGKSQQQNSTSNLVIPLQKHKNNKMAKLSKA